MVRSGDAVHVLHVDDESGFAQLVATWLGRESDGAITVTTVTDATSGLSTLSEKPIDCIVSDYEMPGMDGLEFLSAIRARYSDLPFLLFTGKGSEEVARDAFRAGATDYMQKETGTDQYAVLANRIRNAVDQHRARTASDRYGTAIDALETAVYVLDDDARFVDCDDTFCEITGYERQTLLGRHLSGLDADGTFAKQFAALCDTDGIGTVQFETDILSAQRGPRQCHCRLAIHTFDGDVPSRIVGTLEDVTERHDRRAAVDYHDRLKDIVLDTSTTLMSAALDEIETKVHWTLESVGEHVGAARCTVYRPDGDGMVRNAEWRQSGTSACDSDASVPREESVPVSHSSSSASMPADDFTRSSSGSSSSSSAPSSPSTSSEGRPSLSAEMSEWCLSQFQRFENVHVASLDDLPPESERTRERLGANGVESLVAVPLVSDWTLRGYAEFVVHDPEKRWSDHEIRLLRILGDMLAHTFERREHERTMARYKTIIETVPDGVFLVDGDGLLVEVNEAFADAMGFDASELRGRPFADFAASGRVDADMVAEYVTNVASPLADVDANVDEDVFEMSVAASEGDERIYEAHTTALSFGGSRGVAGVTRDVTEEIGQRRELRRQNEQLDEFASVVSHDLRNPLNVAVGFLDVTRETESLEHLDRVDNALGRMNDLVENVLSLARQGRAVGETRPVPLDETARRAWEAVETGSSSLVVADGIGTVAADETRLQAAFENLFRNAVEHGSDGPSADGEVDVEVGPLPDDEGFFVVDDGPGIPPDLRERVFDYGHSSEASGTGFGLAIVRNIVEAHGWNISVTDAAGGGARFEITVRSYDSSGSAVGDDSVGRIDNSSQ